MITLGVAVTVCIGVPTVQAGSHHGQVVVSVPTSADNLASCAHGGCPNGQNGETHGNCSMSCTGVSGLVPIIAVFQLGGAEDAALPSLDLAMVDRIIPPDPHPPKQI